MKGPEGVGDAKTVAGPKHVRSEERAEELASGIGGPHYNSCRHFASHSGTHTPPQRFPFLTGWMLRAPEPRSPQQSLFRRAHPPPPRRRTDPRPPESRRAASEPRRKFPIGPRNSQPHPVGRAGGGVARGAAVNQAGSARRRRRGGSQQSTARVGFRSVFMARESVQTLPSL